MLLGGLYNDVNSLQKQFVEVLGQLDRITVCPSSATPTYIHMRIEILCLHITRVLWWYYLEYIAIESMKNLNIYHLKMDKQNVVNPYNKILFTRRNQCKIIHAAI